MKTQSCQHYRLRVQKMYTMGKAWEMLSRSSTSACDWGRSQIHVVSYVKIVKMLRPPMRIQRYLPIEQTCYVIVACAGFMHFHPKSFQMRQGCQDLVHKDDDSLVLAPVSGFATASRTTIFLLSFLIFRVCRPSSMAHESDQQPNHH